MRILFLSQRVPYPPNRGDKITTWRLVERMARRHEVSILAFSHDDADEMAVKHLNDKGFDTVAFPHRSLPARIKSLPLLLGRKPLTLGYYGSKDLQAEVDRRIGDTDLVYAYSSSMGAFMLPHDGVRRVMHFAELDSDKWRQYSERTGPPGKWVYRREWRTLLAFEHELAHACETNVFCTPIEEGIFQEQIPGASSTVIRNGVDLEQFKPDPEYAEPGRIVFTGVMDYLPNIDGCQWFTRRIFLRLLEKHPVAFDIIGSHPTPEVEELAKYPNVRVTGFVPDTRTFMREGSIAVAPLRIARGIQNKVLEAMAMGLPVVGTTPATRGVDAEPGVHYLVADDEDAFHDAVKGLLEDPERARELGRAGRRFVEENYDWETCLAPLDAILSAP